MRAAGDWAGGPCLRDARVSRGREALAWVAVVGLALFGFPLVEAGLELIPVPGHPIANPLGPVLLLAGMGAVVGTLALLFGPLYLLFSFLLVMSFLRSLVGTTDSDRNCCLGGASDGDFALLMVGCGIGGAVLSTFILGSLLLHGRPTPARAGVVVGATIIGWIALMRIEHLFVGQACTAVNCGG